MRLHDYPSSGNCYKVRLALAQLGIPYERVNVDIFDGGTLTDEFGVLNPVRTTPVLETDDGVVLTESNAILVFLVEGSDLWPDEPIERAQALRWLFYEQDAIVSSIGSLRVRLAAGAIEPGSSGAKRLEAAARKGLAVVEGHLREASFLVGERYTVADLCMYAYVHVADEADIDLSEYPAIGEWLARVEATPGFVDDLVPIPPDTRLGVGRSVYG
jgi:glutathione S-transferase